MCSFIPYLWQASASSFRISLLNGVASMMSKSEYFVSNIEKPSWWRDVKVIYFTPASLKAFTHSSASNRLGEKPRDALPYSVPFALSIHAVYAPMQKNTKLLLCKVLTRSDVLLADFRCGCRNRNVKTQSYHKYGCHDRGSHMHIVLSLAKLYKNGEKAREACAIFQALWP